MNSILDLPSVGPFMGVSRDKKVSFRTTAGRRTFRVLLYGAYNALGLIGSESNGIAILDEDKSAVLMDEYAKIGTGWFGPTPDQVLAHDEVLEMTWEQFKALVNDSERRRYNLIEAAVPEPVADLLGPKSNWVDVSGVWGVGSVRIWEPGDQEDAKQGMFLAQNLPHGSGIDYDWHVRQTSTGRWYCENGYHGMTEYGMYCCTQDFTAICDPKPDGKREVKWEVKIEYRNGDNRHTHNYDLKDYLWQAVHWSLNE